MQGSVVRFRLGRQGFGLPLDQVREIVAAGFITPVPLAPSVIRGLANVRGRVVTLIDVATVFQRPLPPARGAVERLALILAPPWGHLGVYVHAPVEIGQATTQEPRTMSAAAGAAGSAGPIDPMGSMGSIHGSDGSDGPCGVEGLDRPRGRGARGGRGGGRDVGRARHRACDRLGRVRAHGFVPGARRLLRGEGSRGIPAKKLRRTQR